MEVLTHPPEDAPFPFVVMTAYGNEAIVVEIMKAGALDYVVKSPETFATLPHTVTSVLHVWKLMQERKQAEIALKKSEAQYRDFIAYSPDAIMTIGAPSSNFISGNPATLKMFGTNSEAEFLSYNPGDLSSERQPDGKLSSEKVPEMFAIVVRNGSHFFEWTHRRINGEEFPAEVLLTKVERDDKIVIQAVVRDITERKLAAKQLQQKNEELVTAYAYLNRASQQQIETKDQILSHVSHELRTPLNAANQFVTILQDGLAGEMNAQQQEYMAIIFRNLKQLQNMIGDILDVTRVQSGKLTNDPQRIQAEELILELFRTLRAVTLDKEITLALDETTAAQPIYADPARLRQVITNLLDNAIKFTPAKGKITMRVEAWKKDANFVCISIKDTGCGIPAPAVLKIFDRLYQTKGASGTSKGLGLGLFICRELVTRMGGEIWVESEVSKGSTFYFTVPIYKGQEAAIAAGME